MPSGSRWNRTSPHRMKKRLFDPELVNVLVGRESSCLQGLADLVPNLSDLQTLLRSQPAALVDINVQAIEPYGLNIERHNHVDSVAPPDLETPADTGHPADHLHSQVVAT